MKKIGSFDDALNYCYRLGFAGSGNMSFRQSALVTVCDALLKASGQDTWYEKTLKPFRVEYHRHTDNGNTYPWLGSFDVVGPDRKKVHLDMNRVKIP